MASSEDVTARCDDVSLPSSFLLLNVIFSLSQFTAKFEEMKWPAYLGARLGRRCGDEADFPKGFPVQ